MRKREYYPLIQDWTKYRSLRTQLDLDALERDKYRCIECHETKGLEVHHKIPGIEKIDNLITLCHACHKQEHGMSGCFKKGHDIRREVLLERIKTHFYNRHSRKWEERFR